MSGTRSPTKVRKQKIQELFQQTAADDAILFLRKNALESEQFPSLENMTAGGSSRTPDLNSALRTIEELGGKFNKMREKFESFSTYISSLEARVRHMEQVASTYKEASEDLRNKVSMLIDHANYYNTKDDFVQAVKYLIKPENSFTKEKKISSLLNREDTSPDLDLMINNLRSPQKPSSILELRVEMMKDPTLDENESEGGIPEEFKITNMGVRATLEEVNREPHALKPFINKLQGHPKSVVLTTPVSPSDELAKDLIDDLMNNKNSEASHRMPLSRRYSLLGLNIGSSRSAASHRHSKQDEIISPQGPNISRIRDSENPDSSNFLLYNASSDGLNSEKNIQKAINQSNDHLLVKTKKLNYTGELKQGYASRFAVDTIKNRPGIKVVKQDDEEIYVSSELKRMIGTPSESSFDEDE